MSHYYYPEVFMSRAFMFEKDDMFHCYIKNKDCPHANLRGGCDLDKCRDDETAEADDDDEKIH